jgi:hypothetical protein
VVATGGKHEVHATGSQELQGFFRKRRQGVIGESSVPSKSDATTWYIGKFNLNRKSVMPVEKFDNGVERD